MTLRSHPAEITGKELKARKAFEVHKAIQSCTIIPEQNNGQVLVADIPARPIGESQGGTSISLAIRTPEALHRTSPPLQAQPIGLPIFRLFPKELPEKPSTLPASTAPPRLA